jgi:hypothetical protein
MYAAKRWMPSGKKYVASRRRVVRSQSSKEHRATICKATEFRYENLRPHKEQKPYDNGFV